AIEAALPPRGGRKAPPRRVVRRSPGALPESLPGRAAARRRVLEALPADGTPVDLATLAPKDRRVVEVLAGLGLAVLEQRASPESAPDATGSVEPRPGPPPSAAQATVLERL